MAHRNQDSKNFHWHVLPRSRHSDKRAYLAPLFAVPCIPVGVPLSDMRGKPGRRDVRLKAVAGSRF